MIVAADAQIEAKKIFDLFKIGGKEAKDIFAWLLYVSDYVTGDEDPLNDIAQLAVMLESGQEVTFHTNEKGNIKLGKTSSDLLLNVICQEIIGFHPEKYDEDKSQEENDNMFISARGRAIRSFLSESDTLKKAASIAKGQKSRYASMIGMLALELIERSETIQKRRPTEQRAFCYDCLSLVCPKVFVKESDPLTVIGKSRQSRKFQANSRKFETLRGGLSGPRLPAYVSLAKIGLQKRIRFLRKVCDSYCQRYSRENGQRYCRRKGVPWAFFGQDIGKP